MTSDACKELLIPMMHAQANTTMRLSMRLLRLSCLLLLVSCLRDADWCGPR
jgi:hypothetical protein